MPVQTAIWFRGAQRMLRTCHARYGDTFRLEIAYEGTWIFVCDPEDVKQVFTGDPKLLHAGEANRILLPVVGPQSLLLLDEDAHM
jgi:cytochrome P450